MYFHIVTCNEYNLFAGSGRTFLPQGYSDKARTAKALFQRLTKKCQGKYKLDGVAPLMTDPPPTSSTTLSNFFT